MHRATRRFNLGDLMILIAAVAVAIVMVLGLWEGIAQAVGSRVGQANKIRLAIAAGLSAIATPMTLAVLAFRLRRPRPPWRRVSLQPGTAAALACLVVFAVRGVDLGSSLLMPAVHRLDVFEFARSSPIPFNESEQLVLVRARDRNGVIASIEPVGCSSYSVASFAYPCGTAVAAVWLVLALSGRWRPERSWIDRLGRAVGATWIVITLVTALHLSPK